MPFISIDIWEGRTKGQKRKLIKGITDVTTKTLECPPEAVHIVITEHPKDNWGIAGKTASEKHPDK